ncbi:hypothetical protein ES332_A11G312700v1 [Gossypium tomentosum]|uniref:eIF3a PCI domain-containing protein n=1 Tax=Gossypium tomentosum TaxID=34277 RepID=A0A5D2NG61_GOSTO|nr:hypothetical protein ES332_A11G312700v1 [Gossypium tomentosum]
MFKYVELCVDMRKGRFAKDGLIQYRIVFQQVNVSSLEEVIKHFMHLSTEKAEQARTQAQALEEALDVDDLVFGIKIAGSLEAFRSVEDIHGLMSIVKKTTKASLMVPEGFAVDSIISYFGCTVSAPVEQIHGTSHLELENEKERNIRMANLIGFNLETKLENREVFSRSLLLTELVSKGVLNCATQEVKDLYHLLEHDFLPLDSASKIQPLLLKISKLGGKLASASSVPEVQLSKYVPALEKLTLRLLKQISVDAVKHKFIAMKVDHVKGVVLFGNMRLESDKLHDHLTLFAESLNKARAMIYPSTKKASKLSEVLPEKEEQERQLECEEESKRQMLQKKTEEAEKKRLAAVFEQQRAERIHKEIEERELEEAQALLQETEKHLKRGKRKPILEGEKLTKQALLEQAMSLQLKERQEQEKRLLKKVLHEREQQLEVELSRQHHDGDLKEKSRLARMLENKMIFHERVISRRQAEFDQQRLEREERIKQIIQARKQERDIKTKKIFYGQPSEPLAGSRITEPGNAAPATRKYVPRFRQQRLESSGPPTSSEPDRRAAGSRAPPPQSDRWSSGSRAPVQDSDRFGSTYVCRELLRMIIEK